MATVEEDLRAIRGEGAAQGGSIEDDLAKIRGAEPPQPSQSFADEHGYFDALKAGKLKDGDNIQVGDMLLKVGPRWPAKMEDLAAYTPEEQKKLLAGRPTLGASFQSYVDQNHPGGSIETDLKAIRAGKPMGPPAAAPIPAAESTPEQPALGLMVDGLKESGLPAMAAKATNYLAAPVIQAVKNAYKPPTSIAETLQMFRAGQSTIPAGPAAFTEPAALMERAGGQVKAAASAALSERPTTLSPEKEKDFQSWYHNWAVKAGIDQNPDNPEHHYDYRAAYLAGAKPTVNSEDGKLHWPSEFKDATHPRRFLPLGPNGEMVDTREIGKSQGNYSKVFGRLISAPMEMALGIPPGFLGKIEDAVGKTAVSPAAQKVYREALLSQPFKPSELQEAVGTAGIFDGAVPAAVEGIVNRFPGMALRFGLTDAHQVLSSVVDEMGGELWTTPEGKTSFVKAVQEQSPEVARKISALSEHYTEPELKSTLRDVLAGRRKMFVNVPRGTPDTAIPGPGGAPAGAGEAGQSVEESLRLIRNGEALPSPGEAVKASQRFKDMPGILEEISHDLTRNVVDKKAAGMALSPLETAIDKSLNNSALTEKEVALLAGVGYNKPNGPIEPSGNVRGAGAPGAGPDLVGVAPGAPAGVAVGPAGTPHAGVDAGGPLRGGVAPGGAGVGAQMGPSAGAAAPVGLGRGGDVGGGGSPAGVEGASGAAPGALPAAQVAGDAGDAAAAPGRGVEPAGHRGPAEGAAAPAVGAGEPKASGSGLPQEGPKRPPVKTVASEEAAAKLIPKKSTLPVLQNFKVEDGKMLSTNLETFLEKRTDRAAGMYKFVGKDVVPSADKPEDFPAAPDEKNFAPAGTVDRDDLIRNFERVEKAASDDSTRFVLQTVAMRVEDGKATLVSTDGRRLSMSPLDTAKIKDGDYLIRANEGVVGALKALAPGKIDFGVSEKSGQLQFKASDGRVVTRQTEGQYPNVKQILPEKSVQLAVPREALASALKELKPYAKAAKLESVRIDTKDGKMILTAGGANGGASKSVEIAVSGGKAGPFKKMRAGSVVMGMTPAKDEAPATFGKMDLNYLSDAVAGVRGNTVHLGKPDDKTQPFTVSGAPGEAPDAPKAKATPKRAPKGKGSSYEMDAAGEEPPETPQTPLAKATEDLPPAIEMPELVEMARELMDGKMPKVMKALRAAGARGVFYPGKGEIHLAADIFKDAAGAAKTLAHEIGHLIDWMPDEDMGKGNILGRIGSLRGYVKTMIESLPDQAGSVITPAEREKIRQGVVSTILKKMGKTLGQFIADPALKKAVGAEVPALYKERIAAEVQKRGLITRDEVMAELKTLNQKWKPFDVNADPGYTKYRYSPPELYADTISVLFNNPGLARELAPKFYKSWFGYVERKPAVKAVYEGIIDRIKGGGVPEARQSRVEGMFEAGERQAAAERLATEKKGTNILAGLRNELVDKNEGVLAYIRKAKKMGMVPTPENNPQYALEEMNYASSESKAFLEDFNKVHGDLEKAGVKWSQLGELFFHERVAGERGEMANPLGFTPETSTRQMAHMEQTLGPEKWKALQAGAKEYREAWGRLTNKMEKSGMFSPELMKKVGENPWYSTFDVFSKHVDSVAGGPGGIGAKIHGQIGTFQEISNPATATLMKGVALVKAMLRNNAAKKTVDFISDTFGPAAAHPAETKWNGHAHVPMTPKDPEKGLVAYMEDGKVKAFVVDKWVAKIFERDPQQANVIMDAARISGKFFREVFTNKNPGFQAFNFYRDFFRAYKNLPKIGLGGLANYYIKNLSPAWRRGFDIPDPLVREMLEKKMLITVEDKWGLSTEDEQVRALMNRYSEGGAHEEGFLSRQARKIPGANPLVDKFQELVDWVGNVGSAIEALPKVAGYKYLKDHQAELKLSDKEIAYMVRGQVGSPDFMRTGAARWLNSIFMFSNAIKEGWRSDIEVARARPEEYAWKTAKLNLIPKLVMFGAAVGLMGAKIKDLMDGVPEYDKANYLIIPFGKMKNGRTFYMRMPQDESGRFLGALLWKAMNRSSNAADLVDFMAGQAPTLNPVLGATADAVQYMSGKNPYDWFRGRSVIPDQVFEAGGERSHKAFLKYLANSLGASVVHQFDTNDLDRAKTDLEKGLGLPIASNIVGRFLKVSDYGKFEMIQREAMKSRQGQASTKLDERDALVQHLNAVNEPGVADAGKLYADMLKEGMLRTGRGTGIAGFPEFLKEYNRFAEKKGGDPYMNALVFAKSNEERADLLSYYRKTLPKDDYEKVMAQAMAEGALTAKPLMLSYIEEKKK